MTGRCPSRESSVTVINRSCPRENLRAGMKVIRLSGFALNFLAGLGAAALFPLLPRAARQSITRLWSRAMLAVVGVRLEVHGELARGPALIVANHVSWVDVLAIAALRPCVFVCKSDVAAWPVLGWLLARVDTIFMRRASARAAFRAMREAGARLRAGASVALFPEGTSTNGEQVLPFAAAIFQAAADAGRSVQPLGLAYSSQEAVYAGGTGFGESLLAVAGARGLRVRVTVLPILASIERREAAVRSRELIEQALRAGTLPAVAGHAAESRAEGDLVALQAGRPGLV
jgi:1-acyl-sn-glycerol-3-phosphate acyltransferase